MTLARLWAVVAVPAWVTARASGTRSERPVPWAALGVAVGCGAVRWWWSHAVVHPALPLTRITLAQVLPVVLAAALVQRLPSGLATGALAALAVDGRFVAALARGGGEPLEYVVTWGLPVAIAALAGSMSRPRSRRVAVGGWS